MTLPFIMTAKQTTYKRKFIVKLTCNKLFSANFRGTYRNFKSHIFRSTYSILLMKLRFFEEWIVSLSFLEILLSTISTVFLLSLSKSTPNNLVTPSFNLTIPFPFMAIYLDVNMHDKGVWVARQWEEQLFKFEWFD